MNKAAALLVLAACGGCWYDRPNPWDTSNDVEDLEEKTHEDWLLEMREPYPHPQRASSRWSDADLEAWKDTVLASADASTLDKMRFWTAYKIGALEKRRAELLKLDVFNAETALTEVGEQLRIEKLRLRLLQERAGS